MESAAGVGPFTSVPQVHRNAWFYFCVGNCGGALLKWAARQRVWSSVLYFFNHHPLCPQKKERATVSQLSHYGSIQTHCESSSFACAGFISREGVAKMSMGSGESIMNPVSDGYAVLWCTAKISSTCCLRYRIGQSGALSRDRW